MSTARLVAHGVLNPPGWRRWLDASSALRYTRRREIFATTARDGSGQRVARPLLASGGETARRLGAGRSLRWANAVVHGRDQEDSMASTSPTGAAHARWSPLDIAAALVSLAGVAAIWLPFAWSTSPAKALRDGELWYLAAPFLLAIPIAAARIWVLFSGGLPRGAQWGARALAGCAMADFALFIVGALRDDRPGGDLEGWLMLLVPLGIAAGWIIIVLRWRPGPGAAQAAEAIALMEAAFLVNATLCLLGFVSGREIGWSVTLAVSAAFAAHVVDTMKGRD
jgi:hypothetical protein